MTNEDNNQNVKMDLITPDEINDPYAYLNRDEFTSEKFKIELKGLPVKYSIPALRKLLNDKLNLNCCKIKPLTSGRRSWAFICFRNEDHRQKAIEILHNYLWKGKILNAQVSKPNPDPLVKKRKEQTDKKFSSVEDAVKSSTIPLWNMPYEMQLKKKETEVHTFLKSLKKILIRTNNNLESHLSDIEFMGIKSSPIIEGYRNKCEFSVGFNFETNEKTVGFRLGSYATGSIAVAPIDKLPHVPQRMKDAVDVFQKFIRSSNLSVFDMITQIGVFKQLTARWTHSTDQLMLIIGINYQGLNEEEINKLKADLKTFFNSDIGKNISITSIYISNVAKKKSKDEPNQYDLLVGDKYIYEILNGIKFRISPEAFFQINSLAAEILYSNVVDLLCDNLENATVIDVCCGIGTIGLYFANKCKEVYGIDCVEQAIYDANENTKSNNFSNCKFIHGFAEEILTDVIEKSDTDNIICIIDPPRAGLHQNAIRQLRKVDKIKKLVYISCNIKGSKTNFIDLARQISKTMYGSPFIPKKCFAVDMFPYTEHCELVFLFERI